ncbi:helix-turn-helix domain-containing protein [Anaerostipes sp.]|uniref:helix-turn-helix domain-containing protein n=1 Tax=Anaerostipes sp. TaxID=1872530 RepID=UPI0025C3AA71|nr:helix-turn-helix domain-containing protein [Anaerostipes sp.]MBS7008224.1 XRE family transcriptional regulator [Anaerostipes sp.]
MDEKKIGNYIAEKRLEKNLTQAQIAGSLGVKEKNVADWENGKKLPDASSIQSLCRLLDISVYAFINGEDYPKSDEVLIRLLKVSQKARQLSIALIGLFLAMAVQCAEQMPWISGLKEGTFISGFASGVFVGTKLVGVCIFAYGLSLYAASAAKNDR